MAVQCADMTFILFSTDQNNICRLQPDDKEINIVLHISSSQHVIFFLSIDTNLSLIAGVFPDCTNNHEKALNVSCISLLVRI